MTLEPLTKLKASAATTNTHSPVSPLFRTESVVEKLLTNWMSICLYSFLRVSCCGAALHGRTACSFSFVVPFSVK